MNLKFYTSIVKGLKLKARKFWGLIPTFVEVTGENTFSTATRTLESIYNMVLLFIRCFVFYAAVERIFCSIVNNTKFDLNLKATSYFL